MLKNVMNPKFDFTEEQTRDIVMAAYHLNKAADFLKNVNGMLSLIYNAQVAELLSQIGMLHIIDNSKNKNNLSNEIKLSDDEIKEINDIFNEINNGVNNESV